MKPPGPLSLVLTGLLLAAAADAQTVSMSGSLGDKALLIIDGKPRTAAAGSTVQGVRVISVDGSQTVVEVGGRRQTLLLGAAQVNLAGKPENIDPSAGPTQIVIPVGSGGHFVASGAINGRAVRFLVDTGATSISMSEVEAKRLGIDFAKGQAGTARTANGPVTAHRVSLANVRVGEVTVYDVDAIVVPAPMEMVLLGNSFLTRFQMKRENDVLVLDKRL